MEFWSTMRFTFRVWAAKLPRADAVSVQVYLTDGGLFDRMNAAYEATFPDPKTVRNFQTPRSRARADHRYRKEVDVRHGARTTFL